MKSFKKPKRIQGVEGPRIQVKSKKIFKERSPDFVGRGFIIVKGELDTLQKDIAEIERMLKALIKSLENRLLDP